MYNALSALLLQAVVYGETSALTPTPTLLTSDPKRARVTYTGVLEGLMLDMCVIVCYCVLYVLFFPYQLSCFNCNTYSANYEARGSAL